MEEFRSGLYLVRLIQVLLFYTISNVSGDMRYEIVCCLLMELFVVSGVCFYILLICLLTLYITAILLSGSNRMRFMYWPGNLFPD